MHSRCCGCLYNKDTPAGMKYRSEAYYSYSWSLCFSGSCDHRDSVAVDTQKLTEPLEEPLQKVRIGLSGSILSLDPLVGTNAPSYQVAVLISGQLFRYNDTGVPVPDLVQSWQLSDDGLTCTMKLHRNLRYSDGALLTAQDVSFAWNRIRKSPAVNQLLASKVAAIKATDDQTLACTLRTPLPDLFHLFAAQSFLIHPRKRVESDPHYFAHPVSAGPYFLEKWTPGSIRAFLKENPFYPHGPMAIRQIEAVAVADLVSRTFQLAQGDLDYVFDLAPSTRGIPAPDVELYRTELSGTLYIMFNLRLPAHHPLRNRKVRQAISLAIDREAVNRKAFFGHAPPARGIFFSDLRRQLGAPPGCGGDRNVQASRALLKRTPWPAGFQFTLQTRGSRPGWRDAVLVIAQDLAEVGIVARIESLEDAQDIARLQAGTFEGAWAGNIGMTPVMYVGNMYLSKSSYGARSGYRNPRIGAFIEQAATEPDPAKRLALFREIERVACHDLPFIIINERAVLSGTRIPGRVLSSVGDFLVVKTLH